MIPRPCRRQREYRFHSAESPGFWHRGAAMRLPLNDAFLTIHAGCGATARSARASVRAILILPNATPSPELFGNIFFPNTPLHDGAVIIRDSKVYAAGCFLPKPQKEELISKALGSRHRAAIGMSEVSDAVIVVVSEETGTISIAENGSLTRFYNKDTLRKLLTAKLIPEKPEAKKMKNKALKKHKKNAPVAKKEQGADK